MTQSIYIPRGVNTEALSRSIMWDYKPEGFKVRFSFSLNLHVHNVLYVIGINIPTSKPTLHNNTC